MELTGLVLALLLNTCAHMYAEQANASLTVFPNRSQLFKYESLSLSCNENRMSSPWKVKAKTVQGDSECGHDWGFLQASSCIINEAYQWHSGVYWCESTTGERGPAANITVTGNDVILESPVSPVMEGEAVTLRCTTQSNSSKPQASIFMRNRSAVGAAITGQMTIPAVSKSDKGLYMCKMSDFGASTESWLTVRERATKREADGRLPDGFTGDVTQAPLLSVPRLICHLLVGTPYLLSTILLVLIFRDKVKAQRDKETTNPNEDQMEEIL